MITNPNADGSSRQDAAPPSPVPRFRYEAKVTAGVPIGIVQGGLRIDVHFAGRMVEGPLAGASIQGIDYVLIRADGVSELDVREVITTAAGERIEVRAKGYGRRSGDAALPPPEILQSPEFHWPDESSALLGSAYCRTGAPALDWLNRTVLVYSGFVNLGTGEMEINARALTPDIVAEGEAV